MDDIIVQFKTNGMEGHVKEIEALKGNVEQIASSVRTVGGGAGDYMSSYITKGGRIRFGGKKLSSPKKGHKNK